MNALTAATVRFTEAYASRPDLAAQQRGWNVSILLVASDSGEAVNVRIHDGRVTDVWEGLEEADVTISGARRPVRRAGAAPRGE
jgi:hypothetical protein